MQRNLFIIANMKLSKDLALMVESTLAKSTFIVAGSTVNGEVCTLDFGTENITRLVKASLLKAGSILSAESTIVISGNYVKFLDDANFVDASEMGINTKKPEVFHELVRRYSTMTQSKTELAEDVERLREEYQAYVSRFNDIKDSYQTRISSLQEKNLLLAVETETAVVNNEKLIEEEVFLVGETSKFKESLIEKDKALEKLELKLKALDTAFTAFAKTNGNHNSVKVKEFLSKFHDETIDYSDFDTIRNGIKTMVERADSDIEGSKIIINGLESSYTETDDELKVDHIKIELVEDEKSVLTNTITNLLLVQEINKEKSEAALRELSSTLKAAVDDFSRVDIEANKLRSELEVYRTTVEMKDKEIDTLMCNKVDFLSDINRKSEMINDLNTIVTNLEGHLEMKNNQLSKSLDDIDQIKLEVMNKCIELSELSSKNMQLQDVIDEFKTKNEQLKLEAMDKCDELSELSSKNIKLQDTVEHLSREYHHYKDYAEKCEKELKESLALNELLKIEVMDKCVELSEMSSKFADDEEFLEDSMTKYKNLEKNFHNLEMVIVNKDYEISVLKELSSECKTNAKNDTILSLESHNESLVVDNESLRSEIANLSEELNALAYSYTSLEDKLSVSANMQDLTIMTDMLRESQDQLSREKSNVLHLTSQLDELHKNASADANRIISTLIKEKEDQDLMLASKTNQIEKLTTKLDHLLDENSNIRINLEESGAAQAQEASSDNQLLSSLIEVNLKLAKLESDVKQKSEIIDALSSEIVSLSFDKASFDKLSEELSKKDIQIKDLMDCQNVLIEELSKHNGAIESSDRDSVGSEVVHPSDEDHDSSEHIMFDKESDMSKLLKSLASEKAIVQHYKEKCESIEAEISILVSEYEISAANANEMRLNILDLESKLRLAEAKYGDFANYKHNSDELRSKIITFDLKKKIDDKLVELEACESNITKAYFAYVKKQISADEYQRIGLPIKDHKCKILADINSTIDHINNLARI